MCLLWRAPPDIPRSQLLNVTFIPRQMQLRGPSRTRRRRRSPHFQPGRLGTVKPEVGTKLGTTEKGRFAIGPTLLVRKGGLEPPRFYPPDPKSGASANSATFACSQLYKVEGVVSECLVEWSA